MPDTRSLRKSICEAVRRAVFSTLFDGVQDEWEEPGMGQVWRGDEVARECRAFYRAFSHWLDGWGPGGRVVGGEE